MEIMKDAKNRPLVSIGVMVLKDGAVLMGKRKSSLGLGEWGFPGGHLEHGETLEQGVLRELDEEVGIHVTGIRLLCVANVQRYLPRQYVYHGFLAEWQQGDPVLKEPDKCEGWGWYDLKCLPEGDRPIPDLCIEAYRAGGFKYHPCIT